MNLVFKICPAEMWRSAEKVGSFKGGAIDLEDGYIHFSTKEQVRETAAKHFRTEDNLLLIAVNADQFGDELRWEVSRGGALFPHLYDVLQLSDVVWTKSLPMDANGKHEFPDMEA
jgi:uncharacterized protein (DUF952 family)